MVVRRLSARSLAALEDVHPDLVRVVRLALDYSEHDFAVTEGMRSIERQRELFAKGWSKTLLSKHLVQHDGFGHAVDVMAVGDLNRDGYVDAQDRSLTWDPEVYRPIAVAMKRAAGELDVGIRWGGDFRAWFDGVHFELVEWRDTALVG